VEIALLVVVGDVTQSAVNSTDEALAALVIEVAGKQDGLTAGTVQDGFQMLQDGVVRAIKGTPPVRVTADASHVEVAMDETYWWSAPPRASRLLGWLSM
jgi:hypothetical protein